MQHKMMAALALITLTMMAAPMASADEVEAQDESQCNNNGIVVQVSASGNNQYQCQAGIQYCDQGSGAGGAAVAAGPSKENEAGSEVAASGECTQSQTQNGRDQCITFYGARPGNDQCVAGSGTVLELVQGDEDEE